MNISGIRAAMIIIMASVCLVSFAQRRHMAPRNNVPVDSINLSDPCVLADDATGLYYMTGTGGRLWVSKDLALWDGPYEVACPDTASWMGPHPEIWAAELHKYGNKYYYFATFTNNKIHLGEQEGWKIPRRASHILVSDKASGPYVPLGPADYLPADRPTLDGTFWVDKDSRPYMVFCGEWIANQNGTVEKIALSPDLSHSEGSPEVLFRASDSPWSREKRDGGVFFNRVTDGPWLFRTDTGRLGMLWTSWILSDYTMGVAYSESGTLDGPWIQEPDPITPPNYGHGMIFRDFSGRYILSAHSHSEVDGRYVRRPKLWEVDLSGDKLKIKKEL